ncbi:MAG: hypothetical protein WCB36_01970 [Burkholderiales bacterium]
MNRIMNVVAMLVIVPTPAWAGDAERGKSLHDSQCIRCHDVKMYQREQHRAHDWNSLQGVVDHWQKEIKAQWTPADIDDVTTYLNQQFFRFPPPVKISKAGN